MPPLSVANYDNHFSILPITERIRRSARLFAILPLNSATANVLVNSAMKYCQENYTYSMI
ncbi:hypothetical protein B0G80_6972 [Paraburkholderia sp. BL6669N2]|nr:hypothetical protein B0G80_6972 [Paraburkholderia sp. BL6669N2]